MSRYNRVLAIAAAASFMVGAAAPSVAAPMLVRVDPIHTIYVEGIDFFQFSDNKVGFVTGQLLPVDLILPPTPVPSSTSGCEAADFASFAPGSIALLQSGTCDLESKILNAAAAGAIAAIIFNEGQPGRTDAIEATCPSGGCTIPSVFTSFAVGVDLNSHRGTTVQIVITDAFVPTKVPEPQALGLVVLGIAAIAGLMSRRSAARATPM